MSEEMKETKEKCTCGTSGAFCKMIFASFIGCVLAILLVGAFIKPAPMPPNCPFMKAMGHHIGHPVPEELMQHPFVHKK